MYVCLKKMSFERGIDAKVYSVEELHRLLNFWFHFWNELSQNKTQSNLNPQQKQNFLVFRKVVFFVNLRRISQTSQHISGSLEDLYGQSFHKSSGKKFKLNNSKLKFLTWFVL